MSIPSPEIGLKGLTLVSYAASSALLAFASYIDLTRLRLSFRGRRPPSFGGVTVLAARGEVRTSFLSISDTLEPPATSTHFGRAASNLMLTVALKLKNGDRIPDELRPENHSPLGATRFEKSVKTHGPAHAHHPVQEASVDTPTAFEGEWL